MTADEYYIKVQNIDRDRARALIDRIPLNINRAGKLYAKRVREINKKYNVNI